MHNLTGKDFLSGIVRDLKMEHKELLYFLSLQKAGFAGLYSVPYQPQTFFLKESPKGQHKESQNSF